ncbi:SCY1 protein kinase [Nannizzia gypsea CBS 118893]|uniref:SCY1 protein kinase n=1 Tax=Arthroderma gypseum (strain ATCC MYA-4604 / CBS 118893) TaxID=535722 RepID=E4V6H3_ARTGP|nr:SCY1 protein kinase [Nannizzia gypsea CBS 118893]EFQ96689.1 SCY1 protein kinase [Nannizzia gypsea CBS 118893]
MDFLKSAVASAIAKSSSFPYTIGDRVDNGDSIWSLHNGTKKEDGSACSIFTFEIAQNKSYFPLAKNALRKLRTLRHPGVIKVLETIETETQIYIVVERVIPLSWPVKRRSMSEETIKWGLYTIASTLKFINEDASSVHGAIRVSSIYTGESGEWKLAGFDILSSLKEDSPVIYTYGSILPESRRYNPPEILKSGWDVIKSNPLFAVDAYNFGAGQTSNIPPSMRPSYKKLMNTNPKLRLSVAHFLDQGKRSGGFFQTPLIRLSQDIESLGLKSNEEREQFINELDELSDDYPEEFFKMKVLPELLKSVEFGGGGPKVLSTILKVGAKLSDDEYTQKLTPVIVRLFANPDRAIRVCLLDNLHLMIDRLPQRTVNDKIFPQMVTGFTDLAPVVREQTVKAVLPIIGKLSDRTINGELVRYLAKTANDEQPGIRTNTTICLGKIAKNLSASSRPKILVAAFSRSLRDPFVHARNAGLLALAATFDLFSEEDCAVKVLPVITPALIDKEKLVRDQANKCVDIYLQRIRKFSSTMAETALPPQERADSSVAAARLPSPGNTAASWAGWAISSFASKAGETKGVIEPIQPALSKSNGRPVDNSLPPSRASTATPTLAQNVAQFSQPPTGAVSQGVPDLLEDEESNAFDDWGAMDEAIDDEPDTQGQEPIVFEKAASPSPALSPRPQAFADDGEPDFAGWLASQSKSKAKNPLPKGLKKSSTSGSSSTIQTKRTEVKSKAPIKPAKKIDTKPKDEPLDDDGWGDAWD